MSIYLENNVRKPSFEKKFDCTALSRHCSITSRISPLSQVMLQSIHSNASLEKTKLICLTDFHYESLQKLIRAKLLNELFIFKKPLPVFLLEGAHIGKEVQDYVHDHFLGKDLLYVDEYHAYGWDDMNLNRQGIEKIQKLAYLMQKKDHLIESLEKTKEKSKKIFGNLDFSEDEIESKFNKYEAKCKSIKLNIERVLDKLEDVSAQIEDLSKQRTAMMHRAIRMALSCFPNSDIYVIGGAHHFKFISSEFSSLEHCILTIKETKQLDREKEADELIKFYAKP